MTEGITSVGVCRSCQQQRELVAHGALCGLCIALMQAIDKRVRLTTAVTDLSGEPPTVTEHIGVLRHSDLNGFSIQPGRLQTDAYRIGVEYVANVEELL